MTMNHEMMPFQPDFHAAAELTTQPTTRKNKKEGTPLAPNFAPGNYDVICAKGKAVANHVGNRRFRVICRMYLQQYSDATTKQEKSRIVSTIVDSIRRASVDGGFVKLDQITGSWYEVGDHLAREKVGQTLRDALHTKYSSSTRAKKERRQAEKAKARAMSMVSVPSSSSSVLPPPSAKAPRSMSMPSIIPPPANVADFSQVPTTLNNLTEQLKLQSQERLAHQAVEAPTPSLRKTDSSSLLDIFFDEKHYETLKKLNDDDFNPHFASLMAHPSNPNIVRGKAA